MIQMPGMGGRAVGEGDGEVNSVYSLQYYFIIVDSFLTMLRTGP